MKHTKAVSHVDERGEWYALPASADVVCKIGSCYGLEWELV
jgi:hypothetical protein